MQHVVGGEISLKLLNKMMSAYQFYSQGTKDNLLVPRTMEVILKIKYID